jgi:imidazolonepropionase-like amidohydrolase
MDELGSTSASAARLERAGVTVAIVGETTPGSFPHRTALLRQAAGRAVAFGMSHDGALAAITRAPAALFGLGATHGTIARGKVADVVVWSGDPLELSTRAEHVFVRGRETSLRTRQDALVERYR